MNSTEDDLRAALARRADAARSRLTIAGIRDEGLRVHRHRPRLVAPALVAAAVALVVLVIGVVRPGAHRTVPPVAPPTGHTTAVISTGTSPRWTVTSTPSRRSPQSSTPSSVLSSTPTAASQPTLTKDILTTG